MQQKEHKFMKETSKHNIQAIDTYLKELSSNRKAEGTIKNMNYVLNRLGKFLGDTNFEDATKEQMMAYFDTIKADSSYNIYGSLIIRFLGWLQSPDDITKTTNMKWFHYLNEKKRRQKKDPEGIKKYLITPEEYKTILEASKDRYGYYEGLWESYWLSGGRLGEVQSMKVGDVKIEGNNVILVLPDSKTIAREVPLSETPHRLIRWLGNHPNRDKVFCKKCNNDKLKSDNKVCSKCGCSEFESPTLWPHMFNGNKINEPISKITIENVFWQIRQRTNIKKSLSPHCFRKTRATALFNQRSPDGGLIYSDTHMAKLFGWEPETVAQRRKEYDISTQDDLKKIIFNTKGTQLETFDTIKREKEQLETEFKKTIDGQQKDIENLRAMVQELMQKEAYQTYKSDQAEEQESITNWTDIENHQKP